MVIKRISSAKAGSGKYIRVGYNKMCFKNKSVVVVQPVDFTGIFVL